MNNSIKWTRGTGDVNFNIYLRTNGLNPYNYYKYIDTIYGRCIVMVHPLFEEAIHQAESDQTPLPSQPDELS